MKKLITLLFLFVAAISFAQETPPAGLKSINNQFYINLADSTIWQNKGVPYGWHRLAKYKELAAGLLTKADKTYVDGLLATKVDKVTGKGLSTEDYTTSEKSKLAGIETGAEVNVNADWSAVSGDAMILNKPTFVATESDPVFLAQKGVANGVASLNSSGKVPNAQIPALALVDTYVVGSQAAMLALSTAEQGDVAIRTDLSKTFILTDNNYSTLASWKELLSPVIPAETDPIWGASPSAGITSTNITNWNTAYSWGNHSSLYLPLGGGNLTGGLGINSGGISINSGGITSIGSGVSHTFKSSNNDFIVLLENTNTGSKGYIGTVDNGVIIGNSSGTTRLKVRNDGALESSVFAGFGDVLLGADNNGVYHIINFGSGISYNSTTKTISATGGASGFLTTSGLTAGRIIKATSASNAEVSIMTEASNGITINGSDGSAILSMQGGGNSRLAFNYTSSLMQMYSQNALTLRLGVESGTTGLQIFSGGVSAFNSDGVPVVVSSNNSNDYKIQLRDLTTTRGFIGANSTHALVVANSSASAVLLTLNNTSGLLTATAFAGSATGLTGTASGLTAGSANSVAWTNVSGRPTALSSFTNDSGFITGINSTMVTTALGYTPTNSTYTTSGVSTPTISGITNVSSYTTYDQHYIRVGNEVTVKGKFLLSPTANGLTVVRISFPTSPDPTNGTHSAVGSASGIGIAHGNINMHVGTSSAELSMNATTIISNEVYYQFTYTAL